MVERLAVRIAVNKDSQIDGLSMTFIPFVGNLFTSIRVISILRVEFGRRAIVLLRRSVVQSPSG